jgi:hypothetical protein
MQKYPLPVDLWKPTSYGSQGTFRFVKGERVTVPESPGMWNDKGATLIGAPYAVGDRLYIKEGIIRHASIPQLVGYYMDGCRVTEHWEKRVTAMFMPKWAARTWLEITDVRAQRLQDISEADAMDEGTGVWFESHNLHEEWDGDPDQYRKGYRELWDSINAKKHPWANNDWVWAITFRKVTP